MPQPRVPVPESLGDVFSVAAGQQAGLTPRVLQHHRFDRPFHGVRAIPPESGSGTNRDRASAVEVVTQVRQLLPRLRVDEAFSHETALVIYGCPIRHGRELHTSVQPPRVRTRTRGVVGHVCTLYERAEQVHGIPVVPRHIALLQAARTLPIRELVVALDHLSLPRKGRCVLDLASVRNWVDGRSVQGVRTLRRALEYARVGAESRMETLTRLTLGEFGLHDFFELQQDLSDDSGWIGRFDLVCRAKRVVVEYDGEQHRNDRRQYLKDLHRLERVREAGFRVIRVHWEDLVRSPRTMAERVAAALGVEVRAPSTGGRFLLASSGSKP